MELMQRFSVDSMDSVRIMFEPIKSLIRAAAVVGDEQPEFYANKRSIKYFQSILQHSPKLHGPVPHPPLPWPRRQSRSACLQRIIGCGRGRLEKQSPFGGGRWCAPGTHRGRS